MTQRHCLFVVQADKTMIALAFVAESILSLAVPPSKPNEHESAGR